VPSITAQDLKNAINDGSIESSDSETLRKYLVLMSSSNAPFQYAPEYVVIGTTINHILMQRHIDSLNKQNALTQKLVIALTAAALLIGIPQIWFAYKADQKAETEQKIIAAPLPQHSTQSATPSQAAP
jgi:hypothetical protein